MPLLPLAPLPEELTETPDEEPDGPLPRDDLLLPAMSLLLLLLLTLFTALPPLAANRESPRLPKLAAICKELPMPFETSALVVTLPRLVEMVPVALVLPIPKSPPLLPPPTIELLMLDWAHDVCVWQQRSTANRMARGRIDL